MSVLFFTLYFLKIFIFFPFVFLFLYFVFLHCCLIYFMYLVPIFPYILIFISVIFACFSVNQKPIFVIFYALFFKNICSCLLYFPFSPFYIFIPLYCIFSLPFTPFSPYFEFYLYHFCMFLAASKTILCCFSCFIF